MTVSDTFRIEYRPFSGFNDPRLPIAAYIAQGGSVGDVSGGSVLMAFQFSGTGPRVSEMYNLEQLAVDTSADAADQLLMTTQGMDQLAPTREASPQKWHFATVGDSVAESAVQLLFAGSALPVWLGAPNSEGEGSSLRFEFANTNLRLYAVTIQGYVWGPRSVLADGGPQRPLGGMFR